MNRHFDHESCLSTIEVLQLGPKKIINVKNLTFDDEKTKDMDDVLQKIKAYAKGRKCAEIWIPSDKPTKADSKLKKLGYKNGELPAHLPGNSNDGWLLKL